jgi:hypothetical protein
MKQIRLIIVEIEKNIRISVVEHWMNQKIVGSTIQHVHIQNLDLIYYGTLNTYLGEITINSGTPVSIHDLKSVFKSHPYFIHQLQFKNRELQG